MGRPKGGARGAARRNDGLGCAGSDLGHRPFFGQTGAPLFLFLQEKYRSAGLQELSFSKRPRAWRKRIRIKSLRFLDSRFGKQVRQEGEGGSAAIFGTNGARARRVPHIWVHETF